MKRLARILLTVGLSCPVAIGAVTLAATQAGASPTCNPVASSSSLCLVNGTGTSGYLTGGTDVLDFVHVELIAPNGLGDWNSSEWTTWQGNSDGNITVGPDGPHSGQWETILWTRNGVSGHTYTQIQHTFATY